MPMNWHDANNKIVSQSNSCVCICSAFAFPVSAIAAPGFTIDSLLLYPPSLPSKKLINIWQLLVLILATSNVKINAEKIAKEWRKLITTG